MIGNINRRYDLVYVIISHMINDEEFFVSIGNIQSYEN